MRHSVSTYSIIKNHNLHFKFQTLGNVWKDYGIYSEFYDGIGNTVGMIKLLLENFMFSQNTINAYTGEDDLKGGVASSHW